MPRRVDKKCLHCATLSVEDAIALHGADGDGCWNPKVCHRRRSHYRHRDDLNGVRRRVRRAGGGEANLASSRNADAQNDNAQFDNAQNANVRSADTKFFEPAEVIVAGPPPVAAAVLVLYRQHGDAPVHAVAAEIWQGDRKLVAMKPVHCMGMKGDRVTDYIREMLQSLNQQYGVMRFEDVIKELPVHACPLTPCPLKA